MCLTCIIYTDTYIHTYTFLSYAVFVRLLWDKKYSSPRIKKGWITLIYAVCWWWENYPSTGLIECRIIFWNAHSCRTRICYYSQWSKEYSYYILNATNPLITFCGFALPLFVLVCVCCTRCTRVFTRQEQLTIYAKHSRWIFIIKFTRSTVVDRKI